MKNKGTTLLDFTNHGASVAFFDNAFQHPRRTYWVQPVDVQVAREWMHENAYLKHFGWIRDCPPMKKWDRIDLDTLYGRGRCGWEGEGWTCNHPENDDTEEVRDEAKDKYVEAPQCNSTA